MSLSRHLRTGLRGKLTPPRILPILTHPDERLRRPSQEVDFNTEEDLDRLLRDMVATMRRFEGAGLAAIQVGIPKRLFVYDDSEKSDNPRVLINPVLRSCSEEIVARDEGCLSFPGLYRPLERPAEVTVAGFDYDGKPLEISAEGLLARIFLHELDHLDGINFIEHIDKPQRMAALREYFDLASATTATS